MNRLNHVFCALPFLGVSAVGLGQGSAADLAGLPSVGWPLGVPMTCQVLTEAIAVSLNDSIEKLRRHCSDQNVEMRKAGFAACSKDYCLDNSLETARGQNLGALKLRTGKSEWSGQFYVTLTYSLTDFSLPRLKGPELSCFDPKERAEELLRDEFQTWDFQRFVEFCVKQD